MQLFLKDRALFWLLVATLAYLTLLGFGVASKNHGLQVSLGVRRECQFLKKQIGGLKKENERLAREIQWVSNDSRYVEKIIREELQMVGDNEVVFVFPD